MSRGEKAHRSWTKDVPEHAQSFRHLPLRRSEETDPAADEGADDRTDKGQRDGHDRADGGGDRGALGDWIFEHGIRSLCWCIIALIHIGVHPFGSNGRSPVETALAAGAAAPSQPA